ncbi:MAG: MmgE/PrpD family protein [Chloroflexi bacterium]|nr:MmgE/PrpD family protein [Chloroflexota bacterium]
MNTKDVADFILDTSFDRLPAEVVAKAKLCTLDALGAAIAAHNTKTVSMVRGLVRSSGGKAEATLWGLGLMAPLAGAALVNGTMTSVLDTDDGIMSPVGHLGHVGGCVIPAALAVGEREGATGAEFLEAVVAGYEVATRTGWMLCEPEQKKIPLAGTNGAYGAVVAAARLLRLTRDETIHALGICEGYTPVPKMGRIAISGPMTKEAMPWATMTGIMAAELAQRGFSGPFTIYDDPKYDQSPLDTLDKEYDIMKVYFKPYCACRFTHATLDIILDLMKKQSLAADDVASVTVECSASGSLLASHHPATIEHAEYSFPFVIGAALLEGKVGPEQIKDSRLNDAAILRQAEKVKVVFSEAMQAILPARFGAIVTVETRDGRTFKKQRDYPRWEPEEPFSQKEVEDKFRDWSTTVIDRDSAEEIVECAGEMEDLDDIGEMVDLIACF